MSPFVLAIVVDVVTENVRNVLMSEMLYADDLILMSETMEGLTLNPLLMRTLVVIRLPNL